MPKIIKWKSAILDRVTCREVFPDLRHCERLNPESNMNIRSLDELCLRLSGAWQIKYIISVEYQISSKIMMLKI